MRKATWIAPALLLVAAAADAGTTPYFGRARRVTPKEEVPPKAAVTPPRIAEGGETFATAVPIPAIPYSDVGTTCDNVDDYYPSCAFAGNSAAPDVVYSFTPAQDMCVDINTCGSLYDTIVHVYANDLSNMVGCNDDDPDGDCGLDSRVAGLSLAAGTTYYIVIDGYSTACGEYILDIAECPPPCVVNCPPGSTPEGEPICQTGYEDTFNGGCNSVPPVYSNIVCDDDGTTICGGMGTYDYFGDAYRDTDWYSVTVTQATVLNWCVTGEFPILIALIDGNAPCPADGNVPVLAFAFGEACVETCVSFAVAPGTYWVFAATSDFEGVPCGSTYVATLTGNDCPPVSVEPAQWGSVKGLYR